MGFLPPKPQELKHTTCKFPTNSRAFLYATNCTRWECDECGKIYNLVPCQQYGETIYEWKLEENPSSNNLFRKPVMERFTTSLGCSVTVGEAPKHLGEGVLLILKVDTRLAEVFLDREDMLLLGKALDAFQA